VVTKTITIKDVAKVAGVSTATVSRALSNPDSVQGPDTKNADTLIRYLTTARTDGIIILDGSLPKGLLEERYIQGVSPPVVFGCEWAPTDQFPSVRTNNQKGAALAVDHLLKLGHSSIGHVTSDMMAIGFISELNKAGLSVPVDVSVVGFDDIDIAERFIPALTTIHQPREMIGSNAVKLLVEAMNAQDPIIYTEPLVLPVELVVRDSTARSK